MTHSDFHPLWESSYYVPGHDPCKRNFLIQIPCCEGHVTFLLAADWAKCGHRTCGPARHLRRGPMWEGEQEKSHHLSWGGELGNRVAGVEIEDGRRPWDRAGPHGLYPARQNHREDIYGSNKSQDEEKRIVLEDSDNKSEISKYPAVTEPRWWWAWAWKYAPPCLTSLDCPGFFTNTLWFPWCPDVGLDPGTSSFVSFL